MAPQVKTPVPPVMDVRAPEKPKLMVCQPVSSKPQWKSLCSADKAFKCQECNQSFDTQHALELHVKYIHRSKED
eukprot:g5167.t1